MGMNYEAFRQQMEQEHLRLGMFGPMRYNMGSHGLIIDPEPAERPAPWFVRWCTPDGHSRGSYTLTEIDPSADPMDREAAVALAQWKTIHYPQFLWFISNEQALVALP